MELSQATKELIEKYSLWQKSLKPKEGVSTIHVDEVASKLAAFYEQIRTIIDWKEEHLMRRAAIIRKLKRRFLDLELSDFSTEKISEPLVLELIRGGYFPNDKLEESKIQDVQKIIEKYVFILKESSENKRGKAGVQFYGKVLEIAACEIEETLSPSIKEMALIEYMFSSMKEKINVQDSVYERNLLNKEDKDILAYVAVQQSLFKLDSPILTYNLLKYKYPFWANPNEEELLKISQNIYKILKNIEKYLSHPLLKKFYVICEKYDTPYLLLGDVMQKGEIEKTAKYIEDPASLEKSIKESYLNRLKKLKSQITRAAIYSTLSIFITKIISLIIIEYILDVLIFGVRLELASLAANIMIPTGLMAALVFTTRPPSRKNLNLAIMETIKITYHREKPDIYEVKVAKKKGIISRFFLSLIYLAGAIISFGTIYFIFRYFNFSKISIIINFIFIALILFAATAVKKRSKELTIEDEKEGFISFISDILFLPITSIGRWLSNTWKQYNAIAAFFNALIDMPFSAFVEFLERWRYFIKEKKEDIQ